VLRGELLLRGLRVLVQPRDHLRRRLVDRLLVLLAHDRLVLVAARLGARVVRELFERHARGDALAGLLVLLLHLLGLLHHAVDLVLRQAVLVVLDLDGLGRAALEVGRLDVQDRVLVHVHLHFHLRAAALGRLDACERELAEQAVVLRHGALALEDLEVDGLLVVARRRHDLLLLRRHLRVALDDRQEHAADGLDADGQRHDAEQDDLLVQVRAGQHGRLHRRAVREGLVGVDAAVGLLAVEELLDERLDLRHARRAADEDDLVDLVLLNLRVAPREPRSATARDGGSRGCRARRESPPCCPGSRSAAAAARGRTRSKRKNSAGRVGCAAGLSV
jgi:hypothetical protein